MQNNFHLIMLMPWGSHRISMHSVRCELVTLATFAGFETTNKSILLVACKADYRTDLKLDVRSTSAILQKFAVQSTPPAY